MKFGGRVSPFTELLGIEEVQIQPGKALIALDIRPELCNNAGMIHGGVLATLLDCACAAAVFELLDPEQQSSVTTDLNVAYLKAQHDGRVTAEALVVHHGSRIIRLEALVKNQADRVLCRATAAFMVLPRQR